MSPVRRAIFLTARGFWRAAPSRLSAVSPNVGVTYIVKPLLYRYEGRETDHDAGEGET